MARIKPTDVPPSRIWLTVPECRLVTGRGVATIGNALRAGELRGNQPTKRGEWRVHRDDLDAWMRGELAPVEVPDVTRRRSA